MTTETDHAVADATSARPVALIIAAMVCFAIQDMVVKLVSESATIWQMQAIRSMAVLGLLALALRAMGRSRELVPSRWLWPVARAVLMLGAYFFFYASLPFLTLSQAGAAFFVGPLLITLFAAILLREPIGPRRIAAVATGFLGVLVIVRPGVEGWQPVALLPLVAAVCYALGLVMTRWRCRDEPGFALTFTHNLVYSATGILGILAIPLLPIGEPTRAAWPFLLEGWIPLALLPLALLLATVFTHMMGMLCSIAAYRGAEASRIAPFEYTYLAILPIFDLAVWGVLPQPTTFVGMALIIAAGAFVAWREGRRPPRP
jgi:drug/metabolite transporter (DMT)-like permease